MKIALSHNLKRTTAEAEAEFDGLNTVAAIAAALASGDHQVELLEVSVPIADVLARLDSFKPDLVFNIAEGRHGPAREALYPALFHECGYAYTGSDARVLMVTLDKWLTKLIAAHEGVATPWARLFVSGQKQRMLTDVPLPAIVKPNFEGSSKGIYRDSVVTDERSLSKVLEDRLARFPNGVLVEEFIPGSDLTVPFVEGIGEDGVLTPIQYILEPSAQSTHNVYDYRLKHHPTAWREVSLRCPPTFPAETVAAARLATRRLVGALGLRDVGRFDFRLGNDGRLWLLEINALPLLDPDGTSVVRSAALEGLSFEQLILHIVNTAAARRP